MLWKLPGLTWYYSQCWAAFPVWACVYCVIYQNQGSLWEMVIMDFGNAGTTWHAATAVPLPTSTSFTNEGRKTSQTNPLICVTNTQHFPKVMRPLGEKNWKLWRRQTQLLFYFQEPTQVCKGNWYCLLHLQHKHQRILRQKGVRLKRELRTKVPGTNPATLWNRVPTCSCQPRGKTGVCFDWGLFEHGTW